MLERCHIDDVRTLYRALKQVKADLLDTQERTTSLEKRRDERADQLSTLTLELATQLKDLEESEVSLQRKQAELNDKLDNLHNVVDSSE